MYNNIRESNKSPASPYIRFFQSKYASYKRQHSDPKAITKLIASDWKKAT